MNRKNIIVLLFLIQLKICIRLGIENENQKSLKYRIQAQLTGDGAPPPPAKKKKKGKDGAPPKEKKVKGGTDVSSESGDEVLSSSDQQIDSNDSNDDLGVTKEGWLMVSSASFLDESRYPVISGGQKGTWKMLEITGGYVSIGEGGDSANDKGPPASNFRRNQLFGKDPSIPNEASFYFRLSNNNLYYTANAKDLVVLGALSVTNIQAIVDTDTTFNAGFCFAVKDTEQDQWNLCAEDQKDADNWRCAISTVLGVPCDVEEKTEQEPLKIAQPVFVINTAAPYCNERWDYLKKGDDWQCLCQEGQQQSPIDLRKVCTLPGIQNSQKNVLNRTAIFQFNNINTKDFMMVYEDNIVKMKCKTCKTPIAKVIDIDYNEFECNEINFHTPSEHTINGQSFPMEIHAIFQPITQQAFNEKLILGWLVENRPGGTNKFIEQFNILDLPNKLNPSKPLNKNNQEMNIRDMFINNDVKEFYDYFSYYYYSGSLTTPQCDENVRWIIASDPVPLGISVFQMFNDANGKFLKDYNGNNRNVQPKYDRDVFYFDATTNNCGKATVMKKDMQLDGHFEQLNRKQFDLYYVEGKEPSKLPSSKVIPESVYNTVRDNINNIPMMTYVQQKNFNFGV